MSLLSKPTILRRMDAGLIKIHPFDVRNLGNNSYDVTLGPHFYREEKTLREVYNPHDKSHVESLWRLQKAQRHADWVTSHRYQNGWLVGIAPHEEIIWIDPGETILGHTIEFIGGIESVTTEMKARSSSGRNFIEVCKCAGLGDVGYVNRWTMEITNNSRFHRVPLVVGRRIAQIKFYDVEKIDAADDYAEQGKYQNKFMAQKFEGPHCNAHLMMNWKPEDMLPKQYKDRETLEANADLKAMLGRNVTDD